MGQANSQKREREGQGHWSTWGFRPIPRSLIIVDLRGKRIRAARHVYASICFLAGRFPAPRAELAGSAILSIEYALRRREHLLSG